MGIKQFCVMADHKLEASSRILKVGRSLGSCPHFGFMENWSEVMITKSLNRTSPVTSETRTWNAETMNTQSHP